MPLLGQTDSSALSDFTQADLRHYVGQLIAQVKSEPNRQFDAYKLGGNMAWYKRERPSSPIRDYHKSLGDDPQRVVDDLKSRFHGLLVSEGILTAPTQMQPPPSDTLPTDANATAKPSSSDNKPSGDSSSGSAGSTSGSADADGQTNHMQTEPDSGSVSAGNTKTYLYVGGAVAGGVLLLMLLNN